jgi:hypothetical protein
MRGALAIWLVLWATATAHADTHAALRISLVELELQSSSSTPLVGDSVDRAVERYNAAAAAYDRTTGAMTARIDAGDVGIAETLVMVSPGIEAGTGAYFFRLEVPIGVGSSLSSIGVGVYPLNLQARLARRFALYFSAGGSASWLDREGDGDVGGLLAARAAIGARLGGHFILELGYSAFVLGGTVNRARLDAMTTPSSTGQPPRPEDAIAAGEARGLVDLGLGVTF